jgi:mono/diheme cytochrome c family protein
MKTPSLLIATPLLLALAQTNLVRSAASRLSVSEANGSAPVSHSVSLLADSASGKTAYDANCKKCHGVAGVPPKTMAAKFDKIKTFDAEFFAKRSDDSLVAVLTKGGSTKDMKSFKAKLSPEQMKSIATYIRTFAK